MVKLNQIGNNHDTELSVANNDTQYKNWVFLILNKIPVGRKPEILIKKPEILTKNSLNSVDKKPVEKKPLQG